ncbi:MFS transporter [Oscillibacter sp.]|uniref:MFS transporter n=1 Tax=Oscillibacter sp. TaxID=1945593 RepID=UPI00260395DF|nr:MFS transporter [Oscillibacter sp.]MDD3347637.1 MFS transporter [Oscillibacter sp.]
MMKVTQKNKVVLLLAAVCFWFAQYVYIPFQTPYLTAMGMTSQAVGIVLGAYGVSQMLLRLPIGVMADIGGTHKRRIVIGCFASGGASLVRILLDTGGGYFVANLLSGLASAMWISFMVLYMSYYSGEEQHTATSHLILCNNLGILLGFVTSTLFYDLVGMRVICAFSVAAGVLAMLLAMQLREAPVVHGALGLGELLAVCKNKKLLLFSALALIQQGLQMSTTMSFTTQIVRNLGASTAMVGVSSIVYMIAAVSSARFAASKFCTRLGPRFWIPAIFGAMAVYCVLVPNIGSIPGICALQLIPGLATGIQYTFLTSEAMQQIEPKKKSTAMGCYQAIYALGMTTFPVLCGQAAERTSMGTAYHLMAGTCILGIMVAGGYYLAKRKKRVSIS